MTEIVVRIRGDLELVEQALASGIRVTRSDVAFLEGGSGDVALATRAMARRAIAYRTKGGSK